MAELVIAPPLEPSENRMELALGMALHLPEDRDVTRIADLLRQIGRIEDEFRPEVGVFLHLGQEPEIDADAVVLQDLVDEAGVARLVAAHIAEQFLNILVLDPLLDLGVEHAAGEFGSQRTDQEILELLAQFGWQASRSFLNSSLLTKCDLL